MASTLYIPLGVVIARETVDHPWLDEQWRPVSVFLHPPEVTGWRKLLSGDGYTHYHAGNAEVDLHRKSTADYRENLRQDQPVVYVVLREDEDELNGFPVTLHTATLSPFDAQAHGEGGDEIVEAVAMPEPLLAVVQAFVDEHHVEEKFVKRRRNRSDRQEPHQFGQEPPDVVQRRMAGRGGTSHGE